MSAPYIPLYIDDFDAAIAHLSLVEEAIYMRLIKLAWRSINCTIDNDLDFISRKIRAEKKDIEIILNEFFTLKNGKWFQKRLKLEFDKYKNKIAERKKAGKLGGIAKSLKDNNKKDDFAMAKLSKPEPEPEPDIIDKSIIKKQLKKKTNFANSGIESLPKDWLDLARSLNFQDDETERIFKNFKIYWSDERPKILRANWILTWEVKLKYEEERKIKNDKSNNNRGKSTSFADYLDAPRAANIGSFEGMEVRNASPIIDAECRVIASNP